MALSPKETKRYDQRSSSGPSPAESRKMASIIHSVKKTTILDSGESQKVVQPVMYILFVTRNSFSGLIAVAHATYKRARVSTVTIFLPAQLLLLLRDGRICLFLALCLRLFPRVTTVLKHFLGLGPTPLFLLLLTLARQVSSQIPLQRNCGGG